jgi:hypothetical protein
MAEPKRLSNWLAAAKADPVKSPGPSSPDQFSMVSSETTLDLEVGFLKVDGYLIGCPRGTDQRSRKRDRSSSKQDT